MLALLIGSILFFSTIVRLFADPLPLKKRQKQAMWDAEQNSMMKYEYPICGQKWFAENGVFFLQ